MPVRKFRHLDEMEDSLWYEPGDPALYRAIAGVWDFANRTCPLQFPRGVHRHRSFGEADELRERWEEANWRAFQARRNTSKST